MLFSFLDEKGLVAYFAGIGGRLIPRGEGAFGIARARVEYGFAFCSLHNNVFAADGAGNADGVFRADDMAAFWEGGAGEEFTEFAVTDDHGGSALFADHIGRFLGF